MGERIAVVGATGYTGGLVVQELLHRGIEVVAVGRNAAKMAAFPPAVVRQVVDVADVEALTETLDGCRAVINCVGSFVEFGDAVVTAAIAARVPYVDTSAEFPFLRRVYDVHDTPARKAGVAVVPGMAFYSAPADLASALAAQALGRPPKSVEVFYHLTGARPSRGTLRTNLRRAGQPCLAWEDGQLVPHRIGDDPRLFPFPDTDAPATVVRWPGGEVLTVSRHTGARSVAVFLGMPKAAAAVFRTPSLTAPLQRIGRFLVGNGTNGPSDEARRRARFVIVAEARAAGTPGRQASAGPVARCVIEGHDLYGVTAAACAEAAQRLSASAEPLSGALAPAEAFEPTGFLDALSGYLTWRIERSSPEQEGTSS
jgi:short subunit dehydrogenase-like uncharacterized protein